MSFEHVPLGHVDAVEWRQAIEGIEEITDGHEFGTAV